MANTKRKKEYLNAYNAIEVANRGRNSAYTATHGIAVKNPESGRWEDSGRMMTRTTSGRMSEDGRRQGGATWTMTPKNDDGTPVINPKTGKARQSGRSKIADRSQREYDVKAGLNNIPPKTLQAMIDAGVITVGGEGDIRLKRNGNYSMGLALG